MYLRVLVLALQLFLLGSSQSILPPAIPLAVRSPYLNTWYASVDNGGLLSDTWPSFSIGKRVSMPLNSYLNAAQRE